MVGQDRSGQRLYYYCEEIAQSQNEVFAASNGAIAEPEKELRYLNRPFQ